MKLGLSPANKSLSTLAPLTDEHTEQTYRSNTAPHSLPRSINLFTNLSHHTDQHFYIPCNKFTLAQSIIRYSNRYFYLFSTDLFSNLFTLFTSILFILKKLLILIILYSKKYLTGYYFTPIGHI